MALPRPLPRRSLAALTAIALAALVAPRLCAPPPTSTIDLPGLLDPVRVVVDRNGVPHIAATNDLDMARATGWVQARDRFFQMDLTRRQVSGDLAELLGASALGGDIQGRTVGLRRAAERSLAALPPRSVALIQAFAEGVNAWLAANPLPPEYALLERTTARPWDAIDTLAVAKGLAAQLSLDIDVGPTLDLEQFVAAGEAHGFDGMTLFFDDVRRAAPMDPAATVPDAGGSPTFVASRAPVNRTFLARAAAGAARAKQRMAAHPMLAAAMQRREFQIGSNEWGVAAEHTTSGRPIIANDPHLALNVPSTLYELRLEVTDDPEAGPMNVSGMGVPGAPIVVIGQNEHVTWGATTNGLDVTDVFRDELFVFRPECTPVDAFICIRSEGQFFPVRVDLTFYEVNQIGDGIFDNLETASLPLDQRLITEVPFRSFGPLIDIEDPSVLTTPGGGVTTALVLQYTGFHATREAQTFVVWDRARNLDDFRRGLEDFDFGAQNWAYADADGNLAYFSSAEAPLRKDLEAGTVHGLPPGFVRDGSGPANWVPDPARVQGQAIPFAILPFDERPQLVNPPNGFFVNANNDDAGTLLDNDPVNQMRTSDPDAIYYLSSGYANGLRAGRITRLIREQLDRGRKISVRDMKRFQANTQQLDAELMTPFLFQAFDNARAPGAPAELADWARDPDVADAVRRLSHWDFSTPTGIPEGWDASDVLGMRRNRVPKAERSASIAATIYNVWRAKVIGRVVDQTLASFGLGVGSGDALKAVFQLLSTAPFTGVGASGVDFFPEPAALSAEQRRDVTLLAAVREALEALASDDFAAAFGNSTDQDDYLWGKLHRITMDHPFEPSFDIPPAGGFADLAPALPGISRDGGYEVVNASGFSARAASANGFRFGGGPVRRYVGVGGFPGHGAGWVRGFNVMPGGSSADPSSPLYAVQLAKWLTANYHAVVMSSRLARRGAVSQQVFLPVP